MIDDKQSNAQKDELRAWYEANRSRYLDRMESQQALFDKTLIFLCSGAVAGLVTMAVRVGATCWIKITISFFLVALVSAMLSLIFSAWLHQDYGKQFDDNYNNAQYNKALVSIWDVWVDRTNWTTILCAVIGTIGIIILVWITSFVPHSQQSEGVSNMAKNNRVEKGIGSTQPSVPFGDGQNGTQPSVVPGMEGQRGTQPSQPPQPAPNNSSNKGSKK